MLQTATPQATVPARRSRSGLAARVVACYLLSRVPVLLGFVAAQRREHHPVSWSAMLQRWDGFWYVYLAQHGYPRTLVLPLINRNYGPWGFFPWWPWTIRAVHDVTQLRYTWAAGAAVALYGLGFAFAVRAYAARLLGERCADVAVVAVCFFPGTLALSMAYTEASYLLFVTLGLLFLDRRHWWAATAMTFLACATRSTGIALLAAAVVAAAPAVVRRREVKALLPLAGGIAAFGVTALYAQRRTGDARIWQKAEKQWGQRLDWGRELMHRFLHVVPAHGPDYRMFLSEEVMAVVLIAVLALSAEGLRRLPATAWAYLAVTAFLVLAYSNVGPRPRMVLAFVPLLVATAPTLRRLRWAPLALYVLIMGYLTYRFAFATMYVPYHVTA